MLKIKDLTKIYKDKEVFRNFCIEFKKNTATCIMAPSGTGKTTLLRLIAGLEKADFGSFEGFDSETVSMVFQEDRLCEGLSPVKNILLVAPGLSEKFICEKLSELEITDYSKPVSQLSGGMKRRVAILRALLADSTLVLMDEPFKGLDAALKEKTIAFVKKMSASKTLIIATHDISEVNALEAELITFK